MPQYKKKGNGFAKTGFPGLVLVLFLVSQNTFAQNYDSIFAAREKVILEGVEYRNAMIHWNVTNAFESRLDVTYERKMNLNLSWLGGIVVDVTPKNGGTFPKAGLRYYYNLEERIIKRLTKKNVKTSSFSADYFEGEILAGYNYGYKEQPDNIYPHGVILAPALKMGWQRNLTKHLFGDAFLGYRVVAGFKGQLIAGFSLGLLL